ncbi:MAG: ABC transporter ATP-binding protein [Deltaproteobacteria bacterium]|nr:ABC transporter ATP-binding protein [Deltaproteobacteria bacterium]
MFFKAENLNTYYGLIHALQNVSLQVDQGEIVSLLGRNGMGKSTTLNTIMGLVSPQSGAIEFQGQSIFRTPPYKVARAGVGLVPQERRIFPNLTVEENLLIGVKAGCPPPKDLEPWTLPRVYRHFNSLERRKRNKGYQLSGGEQQMLCMGRALMGNPLLLLVDEPSEGLAPLLVKEVRDVLLQINEAGVSILLVEHNLKVAMSLAHRCYLLGKGFVAFEGTMAELQASPEVMAKYLEVC